MSDGIGYRHSAATYYLVHNGEPDLRSLAGHAHRRVKIRGSALEFSTVTAGKRWKDGRVVVRGAILFVPRFLCGQTSQTVAGGGALVLGVLLVRGGGGTPARGRAGGFKIVPA